jgi:hypothetical protein
MIMNRDEVYSLDVVLSRRVHSDYIRGYIEGFEAGRNKLSKFLYKHGVIKEPPMVRAYRQILSERLEEVIRQTPS